MGDAQQSCSELLSALRNAGYECTFDERLARMTPGMRTLEVKLGITNAQRTMAGGDTLIQFSDQYGGKISCRLLSVPNDKVIQYNLACNALNAAQQYVKYHIAPEDQVLYAERDFFYSDGSFCQRVLSYLPTFRQDVSDASPMLMAASRM